MLYEGQEYNIHTHGLIGALRDNNYCRPQANFNSGKHTLLA